MEYRRITPADVDEVVRFATEALLNSMADQPIYLDARKIRQTVAFFATSPDHFQLAAFEGDRCVAAIAIYVAEMPFFERCEGHIMFCYSTKAGAGARLLMAMLGWFKVTIAVRRLSWAMNEPGNKWAEHERLLRLANRIGFTTRLSLLVAYKE